MRISFATIAVLLILIFRGIGTQNCLTTTLALRFGIWSRDLGEYITVFRCFSGVPAAEYRDKLGSCRIIIIMGVSALDTPSC